MRSKWKGMDKKRILKYLGAGIFLSLVFLAFIVFLGEYGGIGNNKPNPVFFVREGMAGQRYDYKEGVLLGIDVHKYVRNEGKEGNVTIQMELQRVDDGKIIGKFTKIFYMEANENATIIGRVTINELRMCGWDSPQTTPVREIMNVIFKAWATKENDKEVLDFPNRIIV